MQQRGPSHLHAYSWSFSVEPKRLNRGLADLSDLFWSDVLKVLHGKAMCGADLTSNNRNVFYIETRVSASKLQDVPVGGDALQAALHNFDQRGTAYFLVKRFRGGGVECST